MPAKAPLSETIPNAVRKLRFQPTSPSPTPSFATMAPISAKGTFAVQSTREKGEELQLSNVRFWPLAVLDLCLLRYLEDEADTNLPKESAHGRRRRAAQEYAGD